MANGKTSSKSSPAVIPTTWTPPAGASSSADTHSSQFTMPPGVVLSTSGHTLPIPSGTTAMDWMTTVFSNTPSPIAGNGTVATPSSHAAGTTITHPSAPITLVGTHPSTHTTTGVINTNGSSSS